MPFLQCNISSPQVTKPWGQLTSPTSEILILNTPLFFCDTHWGTLTRHQQSTETVSPVLSVASYNGGTLGVRELSKVMHSTVTCDVIYWRNQWIPGKPLLGKIKMCTPRNISGSSVAQFYWHIRCNPRGTRMEKVAFLGWWNMLEPDRQHQTSNFMPWLTLNEAMSYGERSCTQVRENSFQMPFTGVSPPVA